MSIKEFLFGSSAKETIDAAAGLSDSVMNGLDELFTSDEEKAVWAAKSLEFKVRLMEIINNNIQALNIINAQDARLWNSGWRPAIGWVLAVSIACYFIPQFILASIMWVKHSWAKEAIVAYPISDAGMWELTAMMLGHGVLRSIDKRLGTAKH